MCVVHWIKSQKPLSLFVTNRLKEIRSIEGLKFKHLSSEDNPADLPTRGKCPKDLKSSIWWNKNMAAGVCHRRYLAVTMDIKIRSTESCCIVLFIYIYQLDTGGHTQKAEPVRGVYP